MYCKQLQDIVKAASDKTSELIEVSRLKAGIAEERRALTEQMAKLGASIPPHPKNHYGLSRTALLF